MARRYIVRLVFGILTLTAFAALVGAIYFRYWDAATTYATLLVGLIAADVVVWQGYVIKRQLAFSTYLDLDKEWNSKAMVEARQTVHVPDTDEWDHSRLEAILEFFEKLASLFKLAGDMPFIYESTLGWYAVRYFLFAREHGQIEHLQNFCGRIISTKTSKTFTPSTSAPKLAAAKRRSELGRIRPSPQKRDSGNKSAKTEAD
jgi:hypothetical protein